MSSAVRKLLDVPYSETEVEYYRANPYAYFNLPNTTQDIIFYLVIDDVESFKYEKCVWPNSPYRCLETVHEANPTVDTKTLMKKFKTICKNKYWPDLAMYMKFFRVEWMTWFDDTLDSDEWTYFTETFPYGAFDYPPDICVYGLIISWFGGFPSDDILNICVNPNTISSYEFAQIRNSMMVHDPLLYTGSEILHMLENWAKENPASSVLITYQAERAKAILGLLNCKLSMKMELNRAPMLEYPYQCLAYPRQEEHQKKFQGVDSATNLEPIESPQCCSSSVSPTD